MLQQHPYRLFHEVDVTGDRYEKIPTGDRHENVPMVCVSVGMLVVCLQRHPYSTDCEQGRGASRYREGHMTFVSLLRACTHAHLERGERNCRCTKEQQMCESLQRASTGTHLCHELSIYPVIGGVNDLMCVWTSDYFPTLAHDREIFSRSDHLYA